ncbi:hypothetical protein PISMIDRAFT_89557 [Pisolithus microcarpus 441]|uniref:non-specific serine/threonine protein kinase n=1 Tax=Pisolithus microcarpus 441 TaxID=765257 RepID=A0A0D0A4J3_9AGAM|nr:hypothetical protein PISMIDRAFT_89557 [Pisolithus microcarpus 441]
MSGSFSRPQSSSQLVGGTSESLVCSPQIKSNPSTGANASASNTVSMPFVRRHVTRRLKTAKADCDKELRRVINSITTFFEEKLREGEQDRDIDYRDRDRDVDRDSQYDDSDNLLHDQVAATRSAFQADDDFDSIYDVESDYRHSRQRASPEDASKATPFLTHRASFPGLFAASNSTSLGSSLRRQNTLHSTPPSSSGPSPVIPNSSLSTTSSPRRQSNAVHPVVWPSQSLSSRRLSRAIQIPVRSGRSTAQSSRSTSRSRSPLPPAQIHGSLSDAATSTSVNRRSSRILIDDPIDPIMSALYELIGVATDVTEMSTAQLTAQPKICESLVQRVQAIGKAWDDHPDWHGRNWYVQVLLAVASLSRVVEWWEAEKQFWNFDDKEDEQDEALVFVMKPVDDVLPALASMGRYRPEEGALLQFSANEEQPFCSTKQISQGRRSREEHVKDLTRKSTSPEPHSRAPHKLIETNESARVLATERLRLQAERLQSQNIVLELSLDGDHFISASHAWRQVVGTDPAELPGSRISDLLVPSDWSVFRDATSRLQRDDTRALEVQFKLQVQPDGEKEGPANAILYQQMDGQGILMIDREDAQPSHTLWVVRPMGPPRYEYSSPSIVLEGETSADVAPVATHAAEDIDQGPFPFAQPISTEPILCRICECQIPQWYFEKHSETCVEIHRLEAGVTECNESISELKNTIRDLLLTIETSQPPVTPEYRGLPLFTPSTSPSMSSPLQLFRTKKTGMGMKKIQRRFLEQLDEVLQVAFEITMPSLKEEESKEPIEQQRLLTPTSEQKLTQVQTWCKPPIDDAALKQLAEDAERIMRQKVDNVVRMQNTIRYSERVWHEWEQKVGECLAAADSDGSDESENGNDIDAVSNPVTGAAETTASGDQTAVNSSEDILLSDPTPMASSSPVAIGTPNELRSVVSMPAPAVAPTTWQIINKLPTRSSTPSSISSPLALAVPITATSSDEQPPFMDLNDLPGENATIRTRRSTSNLLEPRLLVTPPLSPSIQPRDAQPTRRGHRRHSTVNPVFSPTTSNTPLSPRQPSAVPLSRSTPTSIRDFDVIKPISKGAFGSVFLAKKKATGDYYAVKVLKKADMIAKNQITNVKAERMILMKQAESPFVAKLYFTFQSKENLYLVMEYLNGGDCAALIKSLGSLPEEWTRQYIAEVVLGLEYLHQRGIVHRDLKPDNLLIDQHGHLKLTDFGLSRIGLLGRQTREGHLGLRLRARYDSRSRPPSLDSGLFSSPMLPSDVGGSYFNQGPQGGNRVVASPYQLLSDDISESGGSESVSNLYSRRSRAGESPKQSFASELTTDLRSYSGGHTPPGEQKFVGTPDYLAPETILGLRGDDAAVDWWALGVITYEFLYGIPPFHAETPEKVFENILSGHIEWHEEWIDFSDAAKDFMQRLMDTNSATRLGANGADEVKAHPFFEGVEWDKVTTTEAAFIPQVTDPESTDYFDPRGAIPQLFHDDEISLTNPLDSPAMNPVRQSSHSHSSSQHINRESAPSPASDDFGSFSFKNLPVLKQANDDVIRKLKTDQLAPIPHTLSDPASLVSRRRSASQRHKVKPPSVVTAIDQKSISHGPPSPSTSTSSIASSPSRASIPTTPGGSSGCHIRKPSEFGAIERFKQNYLDGIERRNTMPSRLRTASISSSTGEGSGSENWLPSSAGQGSSQFETPPSSVYSIDLRKGPDPSDRAVTCLLAEDNPITAKIIETLLTRLGCRCVVVADGTEAISVAMGDIKFDCILMDLYMPALDGESAARFIKLTNNKNNSTAIISVSAYSATDANVSNSLFAASLGKPLQRADLLAVMRKLGFKTSAVQGASYSAKLVASRAS